MRRRRQPWNMIYNVDAKKTKKEDHKRRAGTGSAVLEQSLACAPTQTHPEWWRLGWWMDEWQEEKIKTKKQNTLCAHDKMPVLAKNGFIWCDDGDHGPTRTMREQIAGLIKHNFLTGSKKKFCFNAYKQTRLLFSFLHSTFIFMVLYGSFVLCSDWRTYLLFLNLIGTYYVLLLYWISVSKSFYTLRRRTFDFILLRSTIGIW